MSITADTESSEMVAFTLSLKKLIAKAKAAGQSLGPDEIARRMMLVRDDHVCNPDEYERRVLADDFPSAEATLGARKRASSALRPARLRPVKPNAPEQT